MGRRGGRWGGVEGEFGTLCGWTLQPHPGF